MSQLNRHKIVRAIYDATMAVEKCGASPDLTAAVNAVTALYPLADALLDERDAAHDRIAELEAALREAERPAARYRWLRGDAPARSLRYPRWKLERWYGQHGWNDLRFEQLDAAIDADMALDGGQP